MATSMDLDRRGVPLSTTMYSFAQPIIHELFLNWMVGTKPWSVAKNSKLPFHLIVSQYRLFESLERNALPHPRLLLEGKHPVYSIHFTTVGCLRMVVEAYYSFDIPVVLEFIRKRMSRRIKRMVEDIAGACGISERAILRQYQNFRRAHKFVKSLGKGPTSENLLDLLEKEFLFSRKLAEAYFVVSFVSHHKFELRKRRFGRIMFNDWCVIVNELSISWCHGSCEIDQKMCDDLRELKNLMFSDRDILYMFRKDVKKRLLESSRIEELEASIGKTDRVNGILKGMTSIAADLGIPKERKSLFVDIHEKIIEPCQRMGYKLADTDYLLELACSVLEDMAEPVATSVSVPSLPQIRSASASTSSLTEQPQSGFSLSLTQFVNSWKRYLASLRVCVASMYLKSE
eukprot:TRINITY_DN23767_c0_g1_i1.p1 TRINITY_DN23767_c0_g1~~TRINITY_DN23767_c0_g1_i1.p1  ORF type:complete len:415 (-),score=92.01 TRINITY_DN23767_c0_g1_i1:30-1232(-)